MNHTNFLFHSVDQPYSSSVSFTLFPFYPRKFISPS